jgi:hypothetical protein
MATILEVSFEASGDGCIRTAPKKKPLSHERGFFIAVKRPEMALR